MIYEPISLGTSPGFRPFRSGRSAPRSIRTGPRNHDWALEGAVTKYYDSIDHQILVNLLEKKIGDKRFIRLIWEALRAGYGETTGRGWTLRSIGGTPHREATCPRCWRTSTSTHCTAGSKTRKRYSTEGKTKSLTHNGQT